jgi:uncharacterized membrane protein
MRFIFSVFSILFFSGFLVAQEERITNFDVLLEVHADRSVTVTEKITYANGGARKRGIVRRLPTQRDMKGKSMKMRYDILKVEKDGQKEPYFEESHSGYRILYIGNKNIYLDPGQYSYTIQYQVPDQVGLFEEYDEIYWNAIGTDWDFVIEKASCQVKLPAGASIVQETGYVGGYGKQGKEYEVESFGSDLLYHVTRPLKAEEGFAIAVGFEKGIINPPGLFERFGTLIVIILGFLILLPYYVYTWWKYGVDPPKPASYPIFDSPDGLSAASISYISKESYQNKSFTASIIKLAIKGYMKIEEEEKKGFFTNSKIYHLIKLKNADDSLPVEESRLMEALFSGGRTIAEIDGEYHPYVEKALDSHKNSLKHQHRSFINEGHNARFLVMPILTTIAVGIIAVLILSRSSMSEGINLVTMLAFFPIAIVGIIIYTFLIKKPTTEKLLLQSKIDGFKMYLKMAEKDRLRLLNPPEKTPEVFESALPYAFALGVEHQWTEQFKNILDDAQYRPEWTNSHPVYFGYNFGNSFSSTVNSSALDPAKDGGGGGFSGSGGGGFSGGGGGGGGGGSW